jgi:NADPH-dependent 2,4-dienoyl-CoA reductase/sulfur reductase-like enzyme
VDRPGVFAVGNIPDSRRIRSWIADRRASTAVIVGGGFIGLEMVENLIHRGLSVTVLEKLPQVMPPLDPEVAAPLMEHLIAKGVHLHLGDGLARIDEGADGRLIVVAESGASFPADLVILAIGVRPETELAKAAGLQIGSRGGIVVDAQMRTSDPRIWAVGDVVEVPDVVTGQDTVLPLAGPANRQGRVAAESIAGRMTQFRGIQATAVVGVLGLTVASTGASETLTVMKRSLPVPRAAQNVAWFSFDELCNRPLAAADYLAIAERYAAVILEGIPRLDQTRRNEAQRLHILIDALYEARTLFIASAEVPPGEIYVAGDGAWEFQRTVSRLNEMQSEDYIANRAKELMPPR